MSNYPYTYRDDDYSIEKAGQYTLLLQVSLTSTFSFAVVNNNRMIALGQHLPLEDINSFAELEELLMAPYQQTIVGLPAEDFTLVPTAIYDREHVTDFARYLNVGAGEVVLSQLLDDENQVIYKLPVTMTDIFKHRFDLTKAVFAPRGWISAIKAASPIAQDLFVNISDGRVQLLQFKQGRIRFFNSFEFNNADELVYYIALAAENLKLDPKYVNLIISGEAIEGNINLSRLSQFFTNIKFNNMEVVQLPPQVVRHQLLPLTALFLCASSVAV